MFSPPWGLPQGGFLLARERRAMGKRGKRLDLAVRYLIWDGFYGPVSLEEFCQCDGSRRLVRSPEQAIRIVNEGGSLSEGEKSGLIEEGLGREER